VINIREFLNIIFYENSFIASLFPVLGIDLQTDRQAYMANLISAFFGILVPKLPIHINSCFTVQEDVKDCKIVLHIIGDINIT
jgi:hypothetical protein